MPARLQTAVLLLLSACATPGRPRLGTPAHEVADETLPSGLRLVTYALPQRPDALVALSVRAGSAHDPPGKEGLAHLVEHLTFSARPEGGATRWSRLEALGVEFDGRTGPDSTEFHAVGDPEQLEALLALEAERLRDPLAGVGEAELRREREVLVQELATRADPGSAAAQVQWLTARALPGHAYGRAESSASIRALTLDDVRAFARARYAAEGALLLVVGPAPPAEVRRRAGAALARLGDARLAPAAAPAAVPPPDLSAPPPRALETRAAPVERPSLWVAWALPGDAAEGNAPVFAALRHLEAHLERALAGREKARATSLELYTHGMDGASLAVARVRLRRAADAEPVLSALRSEIRAHGWQGPDPLASEQLRARLVLDAHVALEGLDASEVARWIRVTGRPDYLTGLPEAVDRALSGDRRGDVARWLREDRLVALAVVPGEGPPTEAAGQVAGASALAEGDPHAEPPVDEGPPPDAARAMRPPHLDAALRRRLPNGLEVVLAPRPGYRVASVHLIVRTEPAGPVQRVFETLALRSATCSDRPATIAGDRLEFGARAPTELLQQALAQVGCRAGPLALDGPAFDRARDELADALERSAPVLHERAGEALLEQLYPGHPYAAEVTAARVRAFRAADATRWLAASVRPDRAALLVVGDLGAPDALWPSIERRFRGWRRQEAGALAAGPPAPVPAARSVALLDRPGWPSAEVVVGVRVPPRRSRDEPAFRTLAAELRRTLTARFRLAGGLAYRVSTSVLEQSLGSALLVSTVVDRDHAGQALDAILRALGADPGTLDADALARARWRAVRQAARGLGTSWRNALRLQELFVHGLPPDEWDTFAARTAALGPDALRAAKKAWSVGREAIVVVGDERRITPQLRALSLTQSN